MASRGRKAGKLGTLRFVRGAIEDAKGVPPKLRKAVEDHLRRVAEQGCTAAGYALSGPDPWPRLCSRHIDETWRVIVAFDENGVPVVLKIGEHTDRSDPYAELADELGIHVSTDERTKPPCCDDGAPNALDEGAIDSIEAAFRRLRGSSRRRR